MQKYNISFKGQKIFIGIDVHKKNWDVAVAPEVGFVKRHSQKASAKVLIDFLKKRGRNRLYCDTCCGCSYYSI